MKKQVYRSVSPEQTEQLGEALGTLILASGDGHPFVALFGEMGVGKTVFVRGFARAFGINRVKSPTYTLVNEYYGNALPLFHFDLYRLDGTDALEGIGFSDYTDRQGCILCEWSERIAHSLPDGAIRVTINRDALDECTRQIEMEGEIPDVYSRT